MSASCFFERNIRDLYNILNYNNNSHKLVYCMYRIFRVLSVSRMIFNLVVCLEYL